MDAAVDSAIRRKLAGNRVGRAPFRGIEEIGENFAKLLDERLRGLMRRAGTALSAEAEPILRVGDLSLNEDSHEVMRGADEIELTATEFELLRFLMRNQRRVVSKAQILDRVWNYDFGGRSSVVELYISYLRKKLDAGREPLIHTVRGVGYMIKAPQ